MPSPQASPRACGVHPRRLADSPAGLTHNNHMIELENVTKRYGTKLAVDNLSLRIDQGQMFAFLGPNGAGKTTTIKMMCGLLFPTAGTIRIGGFDLKDHGEQARRLI